MDGATGRCTNDLRDPARPDVSDAGAGGDRAHAPVRYERRYAAGEALLRAGQVGHGLIIVLSGKVDVTQRDKHERREPIVTHAPGSFMGELASSRAPGAGRRACAEPVEALIIPPEQLRALLVAEAELGERIMRALILRRVGLLETGAGGPVIVGRAEQRRRAAAARLPPRATAIRIQRSIPRPTPCARALIERFHVDPAELPIVLCPGGQLLRNPGESELARCIGLVAADRSETGSTTSRSSAPGRPGLPTAVYAASGRAVGRWCSTAAPSAARPAPRRGSRTISAFRPASPAWR